MANYNTSFTDCLPILILGQIVTSVTLKFIPNTENVASLRMLMVSLFCSSNAYGPGSRSSPKNKLILLQVYNKSTS